MIIGNLNVRSLSGSPVKTNSPLLIYPDAILPFSVSGKFFQTVSRRDPKVIKGIRTIQNVKFTLSKPLYL